ncbi:hypothetical protein NDU88_000920 [Pleurodeles waltl]|uniref:Uncharacterized protein n=1 Tax=Pleurodeles waltl TaxID=8319 RepID=A0AAV7U6N8_PLEWA|nr:hypothetical protein NDU88_000920 [Pleurodeles waltl]
MWIHKATPVGMKHVNRKRVSQKSLRIVGQEIMTSVIQKDTRDLGGHFDLGGRRRPSAKVPPLNDRTAVKRPRRPFRHFLWAGGRSPKECPPAQRKCPCNEDAGSELSRRSCRGATGAVAPVAYFSVCLADTEILCGALLQGPLQCPCHGPQGPRGTPYRHPVPGGRPARNRMAVGGVRIPMAAERAPQPWRIHKGSGKPAGDRRFTRSGRG